MKIDFFFLIVKPPKGKKLYILNITFILLV